MKLLLFEPRITLWQYAWKHRVRLLLYFAIGAAFGWLVISTEGFPP